MHCDRVKETANDTQLLASAPVRQQASGALPPFGNKNDVAELLGMSRRSVDNFMAAGMPYCALSKRAVRFDLAEVRAWVKQRYGTRRNGPAVGMESTDNSAES